MQNFSLRGFRFNAPFGRGYEEFKPKNLWSLENAFTNCFKRLKPVQQFEATAKLGKFLAVYN